MFGLLVSVHVHIIQNTQNPGTINIPASEYRSPISFEPTLPLHDEFSLSTFTPGCTGRSLLLLPRWYCVWCWFWCWKCSCCTHGKLLSRQVQRAYMQTRWHIAYWHIYHKLTHRLHTEPHTHAHTHTYTQIPWDTYKCMAQWWINLR